MITSNTYLNNKDFYPLRKIILDKTTLLSISNLDETIFETAQVDVAITILSKIISNNNEIKIYNNKLSFLKREFNITNQEQYKNENLLYEFKLNCNSHDFTLINKIYQNSFYLKEFIDLPRGIEIGANSELIKTKNSKDLKKILVGKDIKKYKINFNERYIEFNYFDKSNFKNIAIYEQEKILIQRIRNLTLKERLVASYDSENYICTNTLRIGILNQNHTSLKYILAIINSRLINYLFLKYFLNKDIYAYQLEQIPIKTVDNIIQNKISKIVDEIIKSKELELDVANLQLKLDYIIYELYGLNNEEILIVESTAL